MGRCLICISTIGAELANLRLARKRSHWPERAPAAQSISQPSPGRSRSRGRGRGGHWLVDDQFIRLPPRRRRPAESIFVVRWLPPRQPPGRPLSGRQLQPPTCNSRPIRCIEPLDGRSLVIVWREQSVARRGATCSRARAPLCAARTAYQIHWLARTVNHYFIIATARISWVTRRKLRIIV